MGLAAQSPSLSPSQSTSAFAKLFTGARENILHTLFISAKKCALALLSQCAFATACVCVCLWVCVCVCVYWVHTLLQLTTKSCDIYVQFLHTQIAFFMPYERLSAKLCCILFRAAVETNKRCQLWRLCFCSWVKAGGLFIMAVYICVVYP